MQKQNYPNHPTLSRAITDAVPARPVIKFSESQIAVLRKASDVGLALIGAAGIIAVSVVAPNLLQVFANGFGKYRGGRKFSRKEKVRKLSNTFYYLKRSGLVRFKPSGKEWLLSLTLRGRRQVSRLVLETLVISRPARWNGRWWLVAADIPTAEHRQGADQLRDKLKQLKFYPLQRSLWVYPFDPRKEIEFLCQNYDIGRFVTLMEVIRLDREDEKLLKGHFRRNGIL